MTTPSRLAFAFSLTAVAFAGCSGSSTSGKHVDAYLASEHCSQSTSQTACAAESDCHWVATNPPATTATSPGGPCLNQSGPQTAPGCQLTSGVCAPNDPCLALDKHACVGSSSCAWSQTTTLCPIGANCNDGGYCHSTNGTGGSCACLSPIACPADGSCPTVECDCSGGGASSGGGACTCECPACAPGEDCAPCDCDCNGGSPGCQDMGGTCACACPACAPGEDCPPCDCNCGSGPVTGVDPCGQFTTAQTCENNGQYSCGIAPGPDGEFVCVSTTTSSSACAAHADATSCNADNANHCGYVADPCAPNATNCGGECVPVNTDPTSVCNCPACPAGSECNCACASSPSSPPSTTCTPPPVPTTTPIACPELNCPELNCTNGTTTDSNGCPTCTCATG